MVIITFERNEDKAFPGQILFGSVNVEERIDSLLSLEISCTLVLNTHLIKCDALLPEYTRPRLATQNILAKNFHFLASSQAIMCDINPQHKEFDFALLVPPSAFPSINNSLILRVNWTLTAKLLPSGKVTSKSFTVTPLQVNSMFSLSDIQQTKLITEESFVLRPKKKIASVDSLEDVVFAVRPPLPILEALENKVFEVKHQEAPFCRVCLKSNQLLLNLRSTVTSLLVKLLSKETILQEYSQDSEELHLENVLKLFHYENIKFVQELAVDLPFHGPFLVDIQGFCSLKLTLQLLFSLPDGSSFECQLPLFN